MMTMDERLEVLILRTLGLSQDEVAGVLNCAKQSVVEVDRWFKGDRLGESLALLDDQRINRVANRDLLHLNLGIVNVARVVQITADDILLHYDRVNPGSAMQEEARVVPAYAMRLEEHWNNLRQLAEAFRQQLSSPSTRQLFAAEVCSRVYAAAQSGELLLSSDSWRQLFDAPVEVKAAAGGGEEAVEARFLVEKEHLFPHLMSHLRAEFPKFAKLDAWKAQMVRLIATCLEQARDVTLSCSTAAGLPYMRAGDLEWLSFQFPAYLCQVVMQNPGRETAPELVTEVQSDGSWRLRPRDYPAIALAGGKATTDARCREAFDGEVSRNAGLEVWRQIAGDLESLESSGAELRLMLATVIERGDFRGTCPLCGDYFVRAGRSRGGPA